MEITRIFTDNQGDSHFEEIPVLMEDKTEIGYFSRPELKVSKMYFQNALPHHYWEFHSVEDKIQLVLIKGKLEFITSDGIRKTFRSGDVILLDDHSGRGIACAPLKRRLLSWLLTMHNFLPGKGILS